MIRQAVKRTIYGAGILTSAVVAANVLNKTRKVSTSRIPDSAFKDAEQRLKRSSPTDSFTKKSGNSSPTKNDQSSLPSKPPRR
jgi:hypothetical protein